MHYALRLVRAPRESTKARRPTLSTNGSTSARAPRAAHFLTLAAKIRAALHGRSVAASEDVQAAARPVLRHRIVTNRNARSTGVTVDRVIRRLLYEIPEREAGDDIAARIRLTR